MRLLITNHIKYTKQNNNHDLKELKCNIKEQNA